MIINFIKNKYSIIHIQYVGHILNSCRFCHLTENSTPRIGEKVTAQSCEPLLNNTTNNCALVVLMKFTINSDFLNLFEAVFVYHGTLLCHFLQAFNQSFQFDILNFILRSDLKKFNLRGHKNYTFIKIVCELFSVDSIPQNVNQIRFYLKGGLILSLTGPHALDASN